MKRYETDSSNNSEGGGGSIELGVGSEFTTRAGEGRRDVGSEDEGETEKY